MIITCDDCNSSFSVNDSLIKEAGSKVRCSKCDSVFMAYPQPVEEVEALQTAEEEIALESDDLMLAEDDDLGLDDLDSDLGDFLNEDETDEALALSPDVEGPQGELELDLDFDQEGDQDIVLEEDSTNGDDLPDLDDLDDEDLSLNETDSEIADLDLELEAETDAELETEDDEDIDLSDLGLEEEDFAALEEPSAETDEELDAVNAGGDELDLSDLELAVTDDASLQGNAGAAAEALNLDMQTEEPAVADISESGLDAQASDELDLSDLGLEMDDAPVAEDALSVGSDELGLDLDEEAEAIADGEASGPDELDLSDITDIIDEPEELAVEGQPQEINLDVDLDDSGDTAGGESAAVAESSGIDELDLSDLEDIMKTEETPVADTAADDSNQDLEMDLDLLMDEGAPTAESSTASADSDELDFSDLESMLESDETPSVETAENNEVQELDLQFDLDGASVGQADEAVAADAGAEGQDDDFLDIEELLQEGEDSGSFESSELTGDVTDLPLEMEAALDDASKGADAELELDFDLESELQAKEDLFDGDAATDGQLESNLLDSDDMDFLEDAGVEESDFQDGSETSVIATDDFELDGFTDSDSNPNATHVLPLSDAEQLATESLDMGPPLHEPPKRARSKKPLLVVVLLILLGLGLVTIPNMLGIKIPYVSDIKIPYISDLNVKIPYLSDWLNPQPQDVAGNLKIVPLGSTIKGRFVNNAKSGQLFVIQGQIKNDYDHPRSYIKVTAKLYQKGVKVAKKSTVFCGNTLSNKDLAAMDMASINEKLRNRAGRNKSNFKVKTGKQVPFMIVFDKLPRNLLEYTVEVEGSSI